MARTKLTARDIENIRDAMEFVHAGEYPFDDPDLTDAENEKNEQSFVRTLNKLRSGEP
jgi:hypothetical protein